MNEEPIAKRNAAVVMDIFKGKTTVVEVARRHGLTISTGSPASPMARRASG